MKKKNRLKAGEPNMPAILIGLLAAAAVTLLLATRAWASLRRSGHDGKNPIQQDPPDRLSDPAGLDRA